MGFDKLLKHSMDKYDDRNLAFILQIKRMIIFLMPTSESIDLKKLSHVNNTRFFVPL